MHTTPPRSYLRYTRTVDRGRLHSLCAQQVPHTRPGQTVELAGSVITELLAPDPDQAQTSPAIRCRMSQLTVAGVKLQAREHDGGSTASLDITPHQLFHPDDGQPALVPGVTTSIPVTPAAYDTHDSPAAQIAAMARLIDEILDAMIDSLNATADIYARVFTPAEPEIVTLPARRLDDNCTLVGEADGLSAVLDNQGLGENGLIHLVTEHGVLELDPETEMTVLDEYGIPPEEPEMCHYVTYRATTTTPAEYCDNEALPGGDYCAAHERG